MFLSSPAGSGGFSCLELQACMQENCSLKHKNNQTRFLRDIFISLCSSLPPLLLCYNPLTLIAITAIFYLSVTDVSRARWCVLDNIQCVTVLVVIPGNIHDANCTGGCHVWHLWPCSSSDNHTAWEAPDNQNHTSWEAAGPTQGHRCVIRSITNSNSQIPVPSIRPSSSELDLCFR